MIYHGWDEDSLSTKDIRKNDDIYCSVCDKMVHAGNNEMMCPWYDFEEGKVICCDCMR